MVHPEQPRSLNEVPFGMGVEEGEGLKRSGTAARKGRETFLTNKLNEQRISGSPLREAAKLLTLHRKLHQSASHPLSTLKVPSYHRFDKPYWQVPYSDTAGTVFTKHLTETLQIWAGPLSRVNLATRALVVDMAMQVYAEELLQTAQIAASQIREELPRVKEVRRQKLIARRKQHLDAQLLLAMMHSFRDEYLVALAFARPSGQDQVYLVGSIGAARGYTDRLVSETIGQDGSQVNLEESVDTNLPSSLPSNTALDYELNDQGRVLAAVPERQVCEITRLNVVSKDVCNSLEIPHKGLISQALMYLIHEAVAANFQGVAWEIFNTQIALHKVIRQLELPAQIISQQGTVRPTHVVSESIHGHYFKHSTPVPQMVALDQVLPVTRKYYR